MENNVIGRLEIMNFCLIFINCLVIFNFFCRKRCLYKILFNKDEFLLLNIFGWLYVVLFMIKFCKGRRRFLDMYD